MLKNYLKIAWRNLRKDRTFSIINVSGLATGLAVALLIVQYVRFELSYENTNPLSDRIMRLTIDYMNGGTVNAQDAETYPPIGPKAKREMSEVSDFTRAYPLRDRLPSVQIGDRLFKVNSAYAVDASFFTMFHYPLRGGGKGIFTKPRQVILTEKTALTYFKTLNVTGKTLRIPNRNRGILLEIVGVVPDSPDNSHLQFELLLSYPTMNSDLGEREDNYENNNAYTYVQLADGVSDAAFTRSLTKFSDRLIQEKKITSEQVIGQKISDIHLYSHKTFETQANGDARSVYLLLGVAILVLLSAFVNYVNLTTSRALDRAREIGVRKAIGSTRQQIRTQMLVETVLINLLAGVLAVGLVKILMPVFVGMAGLPENFSVFGNLFFWGSAGAFLVLSIVLSGFYPSVVLAAFEPVKVLKGNFGGSGQGRSLRQAFVVFQFTMTLVLLVQTFVVFRQVRFLRKQDLGLNMAHTLVVKAPAGIDTRSDGSSFRQMLVDQSQVEAVSFSSTVPGMGSAEIGTTTGVNLAGAAKKTNYNYYVTAIDTAFIDQMSIRLLAGENFDAFTRPGFSDTTDRQLIVNVETLRLWGISSPQDAIGRRVELWNRRATIRGVVSNYYYETPKSPHVPIIHLYSPRFDSYASVRFKAGDPHGQVATLKKAFEANFPSSPFTCFFLDQEYDKQYKADDRFWQVFGSLTVLAIVISCLGLFGLATFTVAKRTKEIGVRKVIGASATNLVLLLSGEFLRLIALSLVAGIPITYFLASSWLAGYASRTALSAGIFAIPACLIVLLAMISIGGKTIATAFMNPVKSLRSE